jgi:hypothetical protein
MVQNLQRDTVHESHAQGVFNSKKELWRFLTGEGNAYLPEYDVAPM